MIHRLVPTLSILAALALPLHAQEAPADEKPAAEANEIPADLLDEAHMREELGVNEFTAPSISKLFDTLQFLMPLPLVETERAMPIACRSIAPTSPSSWAS